MANSRGAAQMSSNEKSGKHWRIEEGFISREEAKAAGEHAVALHWLATHAGSQGRVPFATMNSVWDNPGRSVLTIDVEAIQPGSVHSRRMARLLRIFEKTEELTGNGLGQFHLDFHGTASLRHHSGKVNPDAGSVFSVGLLGKGEAFIQDPAIGMVDHILEPADGLYVVSAGVPEDEQVLQIVQSASVTTRVDLING